MDSARQRPTALRRTAQVLFFARTVSCGTWWNIDFEEARSVQERLSSAQFPRVPGLECFASTRRCGRLGGDVFAFFPRFASELIVSIGSIGPFGSPSGLILAAVQSALRVLIELSASLPEIMRHVNQLLWDLSPGDIFGNFLVIAADASRQLLRYVSAGESCGLLLRRKSGKCEVLDLGGAPLGLSRASVYRHSAVPFESGDVLLAVTEGVTQAFQPDVGGAIEDSLRGIFSREGLSRASELATSVLDVTDALAGAAPQRDRTVAVVRGLRSYERKPCREAAEDEFEVCAAA